MRMNKGQPFHDVPADTGDAPVFSEAFLYPTVGKGDARFILGVADEYGHVIDALGPAAVTAVLQVKPRLVQRLGVGQQVVDALEDARSDTNLQREEAMPSQVTLDRDAAHAAWQMLHAEYRRYYDPEKAMDKDALRAYHALTDGLGTWERDQRQKERDRLPEKLAKQAAKRAEIQARRAAAVATAD
jgi:hypothetical protein